MISDYLFKNPRMLLLWSLVILAVGMSSIVAMPRLEDPVLSRRLAVVTIVLPGADAEAIEAAVTQPVEQSLTVIGEIARIRSTSQSESANVVIELADAVNDVDDVWNRVRTALRGAADQLPDEATISELDVIPLKAYASIIALSNSADAEDLLSLRSFVSDVEVALLRLEGTERVDQFGVPEFEVHVGVDPRQIAATGIDAGQIADAIAQHHQLQPKSALYTNDTKRLIGVAGDELDVVKQLQATPLQSASRNETLRLGDLAEVERTMRYPPRLKAVADGAQSIVLGVLVQNSVRLDLWDDELQATLARLNEEHQGRFVARPIFSQREHVDQRLESLLTNLALSTLLVIGVTSIMMGWRASLVVATSLPLATCMVLGGLRAMQVPIHQISVTGLIVSLGLLIDNAIVIVEDMRRRVEGGRSIRIAMLEAIEHLRFPLFASTLTTALAFMPLGTMGGPAGEFVGALAVSVILAIFSSLLLALTLVPAMFGWVAGDADGQRHHFEGLRIRWLERIGTWGLSKLYRWPLVGVLLSCLLPAIGYQVAPGLRRQFFPPSDRSQLQIEVENSADSNVVDVEKSVARIQEILAADGRVTHQHWFFGASAPSFYYNVVPRRRNSEFYAQAFIDVAEDQNGAQLARELQAKLDETLLESRVLVRLLQQGPPFDAPVEVRLLGSDIAVLQEWGTTLREILTECQHVTHTRSDLGDSATVVTFTVDRALAVEHGLSESDIARFIYAQTSGVTVDKVFEAGSELTVRVRAALEQDRAWETLLALPIGSPNATRVGQRRPGPGAADTASVPGRIVPTLGCLGTFETSGNPSRIIRIDGERANEIKAYIDAGVLPSSVLEEFKSRLAERSLEFPAGYRIEFGGESEKRDEAVNRLIANAIVLFLLMLLTLVAAFRSLTAAFIIAGVGGLTIGLGPLALFLFGYPFGFMSIIGTMGLVGIAINDSIVVLAAIHDTSEDAQLRPADLAKVVMGSSRHILATTITTIFGFLPLVLYGGEFWEPLAITVCVGVAGATLMAFCFTPAMHRLLRTLGPSRVQ